MSGATFLTFSHPQGQGAHGKIPLAWAETVPFPGCSHREPGGATASWEEPSGSQQRGGGGCCTAPARVAWHPRDHPMLGARRGRLRALGWAILWGLFQPLARSLSVSDPHRGVGPAPGELRSWPTARSQRRFRCQCWGHVLCQGQDPPPWLCAKSLAPQGKLRYVETGEGVQGSQLFGSGQVSYGL